MTLSGFPVRWRNGTGGGQTWTEENIYHAVAGAAVPVVVAQILRWQGSRREVWNVKFAEERFVTNTTQTVSKKRSNKIADNG